MKDSLDQIIFDIKHGFEYRSASFVHLLEELKELREYKKEREILDKEIALIKEHKADGWCIGCVYSLNINEEICGDCYSGDKKIER